MKLESCRKINNLSGPNMRTLVYFLTVDVVTDTETGRELESYGVSIRIEEKGEEVSVRGVTVCREAAERLVDLLASNFVTPVSLGDIVYDWICDT